MQISFRATRLTPDRHSALSLQLAATLRLGVLHAMSLPSFPDTRPSPSAARAGHGPGSGSSLPTWLLVTCGVATAIATGVSIMSITLQLKGYRRPSLQRAVVRIMIMVPLYALSSLIALFSLEAAFFIDTVRDLYEAFVIYTFLSLLITYLGGERSLLIILHGRQPIAHPFPFNLFLKPMDVSDPWVLLNLKRGVLQYVQIKPLLVLATVILKATGKYHEGAFAVDSGYTYISIIYNGSICLSLYCLAMFWVCVSQDLKPFRPVPKFLCVKGILFFSFWQSIAVSFLVAVHAIKKVGPYTDAEHMSLALVDSLICFEMPLFAIAHQYAFRASDYIDDRIVYAARLPFVYALRDAFGFKDVWEDTKDTLKASGVSYQAYEPAEGALHYGAGRQRRIRAGLRYSRGGKAKYWIPIPGDDARGRGETGPLTAIRRRLDDRLARREGYAPLLPKQAARIVHDDPDELDDTGIFGGIFQSDSDDSDAASLDFHDPGDEDGWEEDMYDRARRIGYSGYPNVDVSREEQKRKQWEEEQGVLDDRWRRGSGVNGQGRRKKSEGKGKGRDRQANGKTGKNGKRGVYGAWADSVSQIDHGTSSSSSPSRDQPTSKSRSAESLGDIVIHHPDGDAHEEWLYDGENEDSSAWHDKSRSADHRLRWTSKRKDTASEPQPSSEPSPFAIGDDELDIDSDDEVKPSKRDLPDDARDLVLDDTKAAHEAKARERRKGEPQTHAPSHVYRRQYPVTDADPKDEDVTEHVTAEGEEAVVRAITPPQHSLIEDFEAGPSGDHIRHEQNDDENPWA